MATLFQNASFNGFFKNSPDLLCTIDADGRFVQVSESSLHILGYSAPELQGSPYLDLVTGEDRELTQQMAERIIQGEKTTDFCNTYTHKQGHTVFLKWSAAWSNEEKLLCCVARAAEAHERVISEEGALQKYKALFDNHPDVVFFEEASGAVREVNPAFGEVFRLTKEEYLGKPATAFLPPEMAKVNALSLHQALLGSTLRFDLQLRVHDKEARVFDAVKFPVLVQGKVAGALTVAKDITPVVRAYEQLEKQAKELRAIFESISDAFFALDKNGRFTYLNAVFASCAGYTREELLHKDIWEVFPAIRSTQFYKCCKEALMTGASRHLTEHFPHSQATYSFNIYPSSDGLSVYFTDISREEKMRQEIEKLSLVASKTTNGVLIMNKAFTIEWVNDGFSRLMGYTLNEAVGNSPFTLLHNPKADSASLELVKQRIAQGESVSFEVLRRKKDGGDVWLLVQGNPVLDDKGEISQFIFIQTDITEKARIRQELEKLSLVASKTNNSVLIADRDWRIEWVNEGFTRLMGYTLAEAFGKKPSELLHNHHTDRTMFESLEEKMLQGEPISFEVLNVKKGGQEVWVNVDITAIFDETGDLKSFIEVQTDITALKRSEQELEKLSLVASHTENSVIITDAKGRTEWVNAAFTRNTGYSLTDLHGKEPGSVLHGPETDSRIETELLEHRTRGIPFHGELINYKKSGEKFWVSMDVAPIYDAHGLLTRFVAIQTEVPKCKQEEANLLKLTKDLYEQNRDLQQFTYIVSHNLRAPVANALGLSNLLIKGEKSSPGFDASLAYLKTSLIQMDTVLRDVNLMLSVRDKHEILTKERVSLTQILRQALHYLQESMDTIGARVVLQGDAQLTLRANRSYLFSIFYNLLTNAIKFRAVERPLLIQISQRKDPDSRNVVVAISDNGIGLDLAKARENIFGLYKRFHRHVGGRGIGLFLVKTHLETMGGRIEVESRVDVGSKFTLYLPQDI